MKSLAVFALALWVAGCSAPLQSGRFAHREPSGLPSFSSHPQLKDQLDEILSDSLFPPSNAAIKIVSLKTGETLYDLNGGLCMTPASNMKLFTSAYVLSALGPSYRFSTRVFIDTSVLPRIILRGAGDPILSSADFDSLAAAIRAGVSSLPAWTLAGDASLFDDLQKGPGWAWDDEPDPSVMFISPLSLNGNAINISVLPGKAPGDSLQVTTDPPTSYVSVENTGVTKADADRHSLHVTRDWRTQSNTLRVSGEMRPGDTPLVTTLSVAGPEWYTLTVLREKLEAWGLHFTGIVLDTVPPGAGEIARCEHRLDTVLTYMNLNSDNLSAENLLKTAAAEKSGPPGSTESGVRLMRIFLAGLGIDTSRIVIADGSGISRYNLVSADAIIALLAGMHERVDLFPLWYRTLPIAGVSGTIAHRMRGTPAEGNLRAKTGTLNGVSTLSGYVTTADGDPLAFSILMEFFPSSEREYRQVQDRIGAYLAALRRGTY